VHTAAEARRLGLEGGGGSGGGRGSSSGGDEDGRRHFFASAKSLAKGKCRSGCIFFVFNGKKKEEVNFPNF